MILHLYTNKINKIFEIMSCLFDDPEKTQELRNFFLSMGEDNLSQYLEKSMINITVQKSMHCVDQYILTIAIEQKLSDISIKLASMNTFLKSTGYTDKSGGPNDKKYITSFTYRLGGAEDFGNINYRLLKALRSTDSN